MKNIKYLTFLGAFYLLGTFFGFGLHCGKDTQPDETTTSNTSIRDNQNWYFNAVAMHGTDTAMIVGKDESLNSGIAYRWNNSQWSELTEIPTREQDYSFTDVAIISPTESYLVGYELYTQNASYAGVAYHKLDGSWSEVSGIGGDSTDWVLNTLDFFSPTSGMLAGYDYAANSLFQITHSAGIWERAELLPLTEDWDAEIRGLSVIDETQAFLAGVGFSEQSGVAEGRIYEITAQTAAPVANLPLSSADYQFNDIEFISSDFGIVVGTDMSTGWDGYQGIILLYSMGNWSLATVNLSGISSWSAVSVSLIDSQNGYIAGINRSGGYQNYSGMVIRYENGSFSLESSLPTLSTDWELSDIAAADMSNVIACGIDKSGGTGRYTGIVLRKSGNGWMEEQINR